MRISNWITSRFVPNRFSFITILIFSLFLFHLMQFSYAQDDEMQTAIKTIWPDKDVKVRKVLDNSPGITITNYAAIVVEGNYEYAVSVGIIPENAPADVLETANLQPIQSKEYKIDGVPPPVWITGARLGIYLNEDMSARENQHIFQITDFSCGDKYVAITVNKDSGSSKSDPGFDTPQSPKSVQWTSTLLPYSKDIAKRTASAVCGGGCNAGEIYTFYKKFLDAERSSLAPFGVRFNDKFNKFYKDNYSKAFAGNPTKCPSQTKQAMLKLIRGGFDAPEMMWRITAAKNSLQEQRGTPAEYGRFIRNLGGSLGNTDPLVRRFVHFPRRLDMQAVVGKKMDKPMKDILTHILMGQVKKISGKITEHSIDAASWVLIDENNESLFDADKYKYYVDLFDFTNSSLSEDAKEHEVLIDYVELYGKDSGKKKVEKGVGLIKEAMFFIPELAKLYEIQLEYNFVSQNFDQLQTIFPDVRRSYEQSLLRLNLVRHGMRDGIATVKRLEEKNKKYDRVADWPEEDRKTLYELTHEFNRNWSFLEELTKAHGILLEELNLKKDEFILTWYLLGYPSGTLPPMEVIY